MTRAYRNPRFQDLGRLRARPTKRPIPREHLEQCRLIAWAMRMQATYPELRLLHASFNPGKASIGKAQKMKREGSKAGFPDLHLPVAKQGLHSLYVEMKTKTGQLTTEQKSVFPLLQAQGNGVVVCRSWEEAANKIMEYLGIHPRSGEGEALEG